MKRSGKKLVLCLAMLLCLLFALPVQGEELTSGQAYALEIYETYLGETMSSLPGTDLNIEDDTLVIYVENRAHIALLWEKLPADVAGSGVVKFRVKEYTGQQMREAIDLLSTFREEIDFGMETDTRTNRICIHIWDNTPKAEILSFLVEYGFDAGMFDFAYVPPAEPMNPWEFPIDLSASPRTYIILIGTVAVLAAEYSIFGWLERRAATGR